MTAKTTPPIVELMRRLDVIGKDGKNDHHNYKFRGIDQIINALGPILRDLGMYMSTEVVGYTAEQRGGQNHGSVRMRYSIYGPDGNLATTLEGVGEGMDKGDKALLKATSGAAKYALGHGLCIPFESDDPDHESPDVSAPPAKAAAPSTDLIAEYRAIVQEAEKKGMPLPDEIAKGYERWDDEKLAAGIERVGPKVKAFGQEASS